MMLHHSPSGRQYDTTFIAYAPAACDLYHRVEAVGSLQAATRALHRHNCQKQRYDSRVVHHIQHLQPTAAAVQKLQGRLQASAELKQDAPSM